MELLNMFKYSRTSTLILLNKIDEDKWDIQPDGFPNTVRWNAGHVYSTAEDFLHDADKNYEIIRPEWNDLFLDGTRPSEWPENVPSAQEIKDALKEQQERIYNYIQAKLADEAYVTRDVNKIKIDTEESYYKYSTWKE